MWITEEKKNNFNAQLLYAFLQLFVMMEEYRHNDRMKRHQLNRIRACCDVELGYIKHIIKLLSFLSHALRKGFHSAISAASIIVNDDCPDHPVLPLFQSSMSAKIVTTRYHKYLILIEVGPREYFKSKYQV